MISSTGGLFSRLLITGILLISVFSCKKDEEPVFPEVITKPVIPSQTDYADCGGIISENGTVEIISRGVIWGTDPNLIIGNQIGYSIDGSGTGEYNSVIKFLEYNVLYYVRAYAETSSQVIYGKILEFGLWRSPTVRTSGASLVKGTSAILTGHISPLNSPTVVSIQFGTDINYTRKISLIEEPITGYSVYLLTYEIKDLEPNSVYHYRITAENMSGVTYGRDTLFKTKEVIEDFDHNSYPVVIIGEQTWMMENLKTTHYSNGDPVPSTPGSSASLKTGNYWNYNDNEQFVPVYGRLYNYYAVTDGRNVCPTGWHVPTLTEMNVLKSYAGTGSGGNKIKESGNLHWSGPDIGASNESEFTALPGGMRNSSGAYSDVYKKGYWLTSTGSGTSNANILLLSYLEAGITMTTTAKANGLSIRCIKGAVPVVITGEADNVQGTLAVVHGLVNPNNEPASVSFEYGLTTSYGSQLMLPDYFNGSTDINVDGQLSGLQLGKTYYYRIKGVNSIATVYGSDRTFTTLPSK